MSDPDPSPDDEATLSPPAGRARRPLSTGRKVLFVTAPLLGLLLLAEGLVRLVAPAAPPPAYQAHPYLRRVRAPGASLDLISPLDGEPFRLEVDTEGFRSPRGEPSSPKPAGTYRIFFVGASTTENVVLPDAQTFPALVEAALEQRLEGVDVEAVNTALSGSSIADSFSLVAHRLTALEPDLIVVLHAINDMRATLSERFDPSHYADRLPPPRLRTKDWLRQVSRLYALLEQAGARLGTPELQRERYLEQIRATPYSEGVDPGRGLPYFRRYLGMLRDVCARAEVPLAVMTMPSLYKPDLSQAERDALWMGWVNKGELNLSPDTLSEGMRRYNQAIREFAGQEGLLLIDLAPAVPKDLEHLYDDCHATARGNQVMADAITEALLAGGALPEWPRGR